MIRQFVEPSAAYENPYQSPTATVPADGAPSTSTHDVANLAGTIKLCAASISFYPIVVICFLALPLDWGTLVAIGEVLLGFSLIYASRSAARRTAT